MATIKSVSMSRRENERIYLSGYVDGLETGYNYCIVYSHNGGPVKNVGRGGMPYTFIGLSSMAKGTYRKHNFSDTGSWVPDDGDGTYEIICNMVGSRCETIHVQESAKSFSVTTTAPTPTPTPTPTPPTPTCNEGETVCEYNTAYSRYMLMKCVGGKMVFEKWCGTDDTCEDGVCTSPPTPTPTPTPPACEEGATVCEYNEGQQRYMLKKCVGGKMVFEKWCGADDTCEDGVCTSPPTPTPTPTPPACEEGAIVCEYHAGQQRYLLKKCVGGKMVFEKWCGADDTCEDGVCISPPTPTPTPTPPAIPHTTQPKYLTPEQADERIRAGLPCYIKCVLPLLDMLPGIPYTLGMWVPPLCAITAEP